MSNKKECDNCLYFFSEKYGIELKGICMLPIFLGGMKKVVNHNDLCIDWIGDNDPSWKKTIIDGFFVEVEEIKKAIKKLKEEIDS